VPAPQTYQVQPGDTLSSIAQRFGVSPETVQWANGMANPNNLSVGQTLTVLPMAGVSHQVKPGESLSSIAALYGVPVASIADCNGIDERALLQVGQTILVPGARLAPTPTASPTPRPFRAAADGRVVNLQQTQSGYGWFVVIDHGGGIKTPYAHLGGFNVKLGNSVTRGQQTGAVGMTGLTTGPPPPLRGDPERPTGESVGLPFS